jgi:arylformamidase
MTEYRASFDAAIRFGNGGDLTAHGFRVDVPSPDTDEDAIAALFVASLGLLMTDSVTLTNVEVFAEPHKGTRGVCSATPPTGARFTAVPLRIEKLGTIPVRAFARLPG